MGIHATPLLSYFHYNDYPSISTDAILDLNEEELRLFTIGYVHCCNHVREVMGDSKRAFLTAALDEPEAVQERLLSYVYLLDSLDETLERRSDSLENGVLKKLQ